MPYAVWKKMGGVPGLDRYEVGDLILKCNIAIPITVEQEKIAKHLIGVITFDDVDIPEKKEIKIMEEAKIEVGSKLKKGLEEI